MVKKRWVKSTAILVVFVSNLIILAKDGFGVLPVLAALLAGVVLVWDVIDAVQAGRKD